MSAPDAWLAARFADIRPKAVAALTRQFRDIEIAEEAFSASCLKALQIWPARGLPEDPLAWLLAVGRNAARDMLRKTARACRYAEGDDERGLPEGALADRVDAGDLRDDVLRLLFVCCHPELTPQDQSALALKIVAGLTVSEIARAFLVSPKAMEQRLTRAKRTVTAADVPFETPGLAERHRRLKTVSLMAYLMFNEGWSASRGEAQIKAPLCEEAIRLARLLLDLFPSVSESMGLIALFLLQHSRQRARLDERGNLVLLDDQDRGLWDRPMIAEAQSLLDKALRHGSPGPYQIQAAIAAVHAAAARSEETDWREIERLYGALELIEPTPVVRLNHAAAVAEVHGPQAGLDQLDALSDDLSSYRWFHTTRAALLMEMNDHGPAIVALECALTLDPTEPERRHIDTKIAECKKNL